MVTVSINRPMGSVHPKHGFLYAVNYGFVPDVAAPDGGDLDAYLLGVFEPVNEFTGRCIAVVHRTDDDDDKLVVVPDGRSYTDDQIRALTEFQEHWFSSVIWRELLLKRAPKRGTWSLLARPHRRHRHPRGEDPVPADRWLVFWRMALMVASSLVSSFTVDRPKASTIQMARRESRS